MPPIRNNAPEPRLNPSLRTWLVRPPTWSCASNSTTSWPCLPRVYAAAHPAGPPPTTASLVRDLPESTYSRTRQSRGRANPVEVPERGHRVVRACVGSGRDLVEQPASGFRGKLDDHRGDHQEAGDQQERAEHRHAGHISADDQHADPAAEVADPVDQAEARGAGPRRKTLGRQCEGRSHPD